MIDWISVGTGALWITGLAIVLATLSHAHWRARERGERVRAILGIHGYQATLDLGLALVCMGLFFTARSIWERLAWAVLTVLSAAGSVERWRARRSSRPMCD